jgi:hypothetical protein
MLSHLEGKHLQLHCQSLLLTLLGLSCGRWFSALRSALMDKCLCTSPVLEIFTISSLALESSGQNLQRTVG